MRLLFLFLTLTFTLFAANAKDAAFMLDFEEDYHIALEKARQEDKLLMLVIVQETCPYCEMMVEKTLSDPRITVVLKKFVSVIIDKHGEFPEEFRTRITPVCFFIDPKNGVGIWESLGYVKPKAFFEVLKDAQEMRDAKD